jgi:hypothetical protein
MTAISAFCTVSALKKKKKRKDDIPNLIEVERGLGHQVSRAHETWRGIIQ